MAALRMGRPEQARYYWIVTVRRDGPPHAGPVWGVWLAGALYWGQQTWPCVVDHDQAIAFELRFPGPLTAIAMVAVTDARACRFAQLNERARSAFLEGAAEESTRASRPGYLS